MAKETKALSLKELREKYPEVKAVSKVEFLKKLKSHLEALRKPIGAPAPPTTPIADENPPEAKKEAKAEVKAEKKDEPKAKKEKRSKLAEKYANENSDFIEEIVSGEKECVIIVGAPDSRYFKILRYRGQYGPTSTIHSSRGKKLADIVAIAKLEA